MYDMQSSSGLEHKTLNSQCFAELVELKTSVNFSKETLAYFKF